MKRPVTALLLVAGGLFLLLGKRCGLVGDLAATASRHLFGSLGTGLLVLTAWAVAVVLVVPQGSLMRVCRQMIRRKRPKVPARKIVPKVQKMRTGSYSMHDESFGKRVQDDVKLRDVCSVLKNLGFAKHEYESLMTGFDLTRSVESIVKTTLGSMRRN